MIDQGAIQLIQDTAVAAQPRLFHVPSDPPDVHYLVGCGEKGEYGTTRIVTEPAPRNYKALTTEDFAALVVRQFSLPTPLEPRETSVEPTMTAPPVIRKTAGPKMVMVGRTAIVATVDEAERREWVSLVLTTTTALDTLNKCDDSRTPQGQSDFVNMLRIELAGCVDPIIVEAFRHLVFGKVSGGESAVSNSNKAVSSAIKMTLAAGGNDIPDEIVCGLTVYEQFPEFGVQVRCAVQTIVEDAAFLLIPLAGELFRAEEKTRTAIAARLRELLGDDAIGVYQGQF